MVRKSKDKTIGNEDKEFRRKYMRKDGIFYIEEQRETTLGRRIYVYRHKRLFGHKLHYC